MTLAIEVPCKVVGVYSTIHMPDGDYDTGSPTRVEIDCEVVTYYLPLRNAPFSGEINNATLHLGVLTVRVPVSPVQVLQGDNVTIAQPVSMMKFVNRNSPIALEERVADSPYFRILHPILRSLVFRVVTYLTEHEKHRLGPQHSHSDCKECNTRGWSL